MMTKEQYIDYWIETSNNDWVTVEAMFVAGRYLHCLFWAHLVLEKLAKALWVKNHTENIPPKVHNIVWLIEEALVEITSEDKIFLEVFNRFQLSTRYPDYLRKIESICTKNLTIEQLDKVNEIRQCLLNKLP
jgi:HEPN domain-containing protein